jgi:thiamine biosynthesis lipoprotein
MRVMGTNAHVVAVGADRRLVDDAAARLEDLERRWSRFLLDSEVSRCNALSGRPVAVSPETVRLVSCAVSGWTATGGTFDPTVLNALCDAGYDRDFRSAVGRASTLTPSGPRAAPGCAEITWNERDCTVTLPAGTRFDPGGIGKGLAADIVTEEMIAAGAAGALVSVGGDLRVRGEPPAGSAWDLAIDDASRAGDELLRLGLHDGAVATSSRLQRAWRTRTGDAHHLIDPSTGAPAISPFVAVSAIAREGWWAEIVAKAVLIAGLGVDAGDRFAALLVTVAADGTVAFDPRLAAIAA